MDSCVGNQDEQNWENNALRTNGFLCDVALIIVIILSLVPVSFKKTKSNYSRVTKRRNASAERKYIKIVSTKIGQTMKTINLDDNESRKPAEKSRNSIGKTRDSKKKDDCSKIKPQDENSVKLDYIETPVSTRRNRSHSVGVNAF
uniref:Transmembrane protein n=2 Tax=Rhabditophanes sp. KR3021 TaxID=114890 RepID=A0AC35TKW5_9BILA